MVLLIRLIAHSTPAARPTGHWPGVDFIAQNRRPVGAIKAKLGAIAGRQRALSLARRRLHAIAYHEDASSGRVRWWRRDRWVATHP